MSRQLTLANKRSDGRDQRSTLSGGEKDSTSLGSRGSCGSLDTVGLPGSYSHELSPHEEDGSLRSATGTIPPGDAGWGVARASGGEIHEACEDRIARLERAVGRGKDKLDFLQDHVEQLQEEINRKAAIIRSYVLREEAGSLAPEASDRVKAQLSRKGGIMASVYSSHNLDEGMTIGLSLEINRKLQALLEDTLLKNIKLKEGMDTLGAEIDWLSHENKQLLQQIKCSSGGGSGAATQRSTLSQQNGERRS